MPPGVASSASGYVADGDIGRLEDLHVLACCDYGVLSFWVMHVPILQKSLALRWHFEVHLTKQATIVVTQLRL